MQRRELLKYALALSGSGILGVASTSATPYAQTRSGKIRGYFSGEVAVFKGIPYGADTAARRFREAEREQSWAGVRDCSEFGESASQLGADGPGSEDCLFLNVYAPGFGREKASRSIANRPILIYLHGGGYNTGSGSSRLYDGVRLCQRGDVLVITLNHRLNVFGYLYLGELDANMASSGNVGQLDLVQALRWVAQHAQEFGGDANNVTLFGQSGGGAKIATLMAMPATQPTIPASSNSSVLTQGLFHRAWTMSGQQVTAAGPRAAAGRTLILLDALKLRPGEWRKLLALPVATLLEASQCRDPSRVENMALYFGPVLDGRSLPRHPFFPEAPAQSAHIPMVIGNTHDETRAFLGKDPANFSISWDDLPERLRGQQYLDLPVDVVVEKYRAWYPKYTPSDVFFAATTAARSWRGAVLEAEARARQANNTWVYQLDWRSPQADGKLGAMHTLDIPLVFDNIKNAGEQTGTSAQAQALADQMSEALIAFARSGNPNHKRLPHWPNYQLERRETMIFDAKPKLQFDPRGQERKLFEQVPFVQRGTF